MMFKIKYTKGQLVFVVVWLSLMISALVWGFIGQHTVVIATALIGMTLPIFLLQIVAMDQICKELGRLKEYKGSVAEEFEKIWDCANRKALEALVFKANEFPLEEKTMSSEEGKKFIEDKRDRYIETMLAMEQIREESI